MESQREVAEERVERRNQAERRREVWEMIVGLRKYRGKLPADFKFDREEANERR